MDLCHEVMLLLFNTPASVSGSFSPTRLSIRCLPPGHQLACPCISFCAFICRLNPSSILGHGFEPTGSKVLCGERQLIHTCWDLETVFPASWQLAPGKGFWVEGKGSRGFVTVRAALRAVPAPAVPPRRPSSRPQPCVLPGPPVLTASSSCGLALNHLMQFPFSDGTVRWVSEVSPGSKGRKKRLGRWGPETEPRVGGDAKKAVFGDPVSRHEGARCHRQRRGSDPEPREGREATEKVAENRALDAERGAGSWALRRPVTALISLRPDRFSKKKT